MSEKHAILYSNEANDTGFKMAKKTEKLLKKIGWTSSVYTYPVVPDIEGAGILITFGGDGTILHAARAAAVCNVPILGINMGGKGFIAELEPGDIGLIEKIATGDFDLESRMMIDIEVWRDFKVIHSDFALNDLVIKGDNKVIEMTVFADGQRITRFSGDGTIIATPTGSTAYSMSAGGPIVEPCAKNIIVTPICAHILEAKSFVLVADREITIETELKKDTPAYISVDGGDHINILHADVIKVCKSPKSINLVRVSGKSFYHKLSSKLIASIS